MTKKRCSWCNDDPGMIKYHDEEWGFPEEDDNLLFERMVIEQFQAGLNWTLTFNKRPALRRAFSDFDIQKVSRYTEKDIEKLMKDPSIIRNRLKIASTIHNAKQVVEIQKEFGSFKNFVYSLPDDLPEANKLLKERFKFMGLEIARMFLMGIGKIGPSHEENCWLSER